MIEAVKAWLESHGCYDVVPITVEIAGKSAKLLSRLPAASYQGCEYWQPAVAPAGSRTAGEPYVIHALYLLADKLPLRGKRMCFPREGDEHEWYIASYSAKLHPGKPLPSVIARTPAEEEARRREYEPFGTSFMLCPWECEGKVDDGERSPYQRVPMKVTTEGTTARF